MPTQIDIWETVHPGHHDDDQWYVQPRYDAYTHTLSLDNPQRWTPKAGSTKNVAETRTPSTADLSPSLQQRLDNANAYFRRKAATVFADDVALKLLAVLYEDSVIELADFDPRKHGIPLAKLTAANFCEVGANVIYITESGQRFIASIQNHE